MITSDPNPVIKVWPKCPECSLAYVLRRCFSLTGEPGWMWQRDCKHKKVQPVVEQEPLDGGVNEP